MTIVVILHFLAHFSIENSPVTRYICGSVDVFVLAAKGEGSPTCPPFAGHRRGRSLRNTHVLNRAAEACVALWTVSRAALERCLIRICIRPLDKSQRFLYLLDRQWLTLESRFSRWVLMLQNQCCLGFYTEPYIHC